MMSTEIHQIVCRVYENFLNLPDLQRVELVP